MRKTLLCLVVTAVLVTGCTGRSIDEMRGRGPVAAGGTSSSATRSARTINEQADIYAAVIRRLVTRDHTFGEGTSPFGHVYVLDGPVPGAGKPTNVTLIDPPRTFERATIAGIRDRLMDLPPITFIPGPHRVRKGKDGLGGVKNEGVIISLGPIERSGANVEVPNALWCGGLCGQWLTYVLREHDEGWKVTGTTGTYAIS